MTDPDLYIDDFFIEIKETFPSLLQLTTWKDCEDDPLGRYIILEDIAEEMIVWTNKGFLLETNRMLGFIEFHLGQGHPYVQLLIQNNFLSCIAEIEDHQLKAKILEMMGTATLSEYHKLED